jgi:hypothetical protein
LWKFFAVEYLWVLSPLVAIAFLAAFALICVKRTPSDKLLISMLAVNAAFYAFFNFHTYYLLPLVPWSALAVGRAALWALEWRRERKGGESAASWSAVAITALVTALIVGLFAISMMGEKKWGAYSPAYLERDMRAAGVDPEKSRLLLDDGMDIVGPPLTWYAPNLKFQSAQAQGFETIPNDKPTIIFSGELLEPIDGATEIATMVTRKPRVVLFGFAMRFTTRDTNGLPVNAHFFNPGPLMIERVGPPWRFGTEIHEQESVLYRLYSHVNPNPPEASTESSVTP